MCGALKLGVRSLARRAPESGINPNSARKRSGRPSRRNPTDLWRANCKFEHSDNRRSRFPNWNATTRLTRATLSETRIRRAAAESEETREERWRRDDSREETSYNSATTWYTQAATAGEVKKHELLAHKSCGFQKNKSRASRFIVKRISTSKLLSRIYVKICSNQ